jgi:hypothetical protein
MSDKLGKKLLKLAREDRKALLELLNENYDSESWIVFSAVGETEGSGDDVAYCRDCGATGDGKGDFCGACRSDHICFGEVIEALEVIALGTGDFEDIRDSASMDDNDF